MMAHKILVVLLIVAAISSLALAKPSGKSKKDDEPKKGNGPKKGVENAPDSEENLEKRLEGAALGSSCIATKDCDENLQCLNNKCACPKTHYPSGTNQCLKKIAYGHSCDNLAKCAGNLECFNLSCVCPNTKYLSGTNHCDDKITKAGDLCPGARTCAEPMTCLRGRCVCPDGSMSRYSVC
jgi:hypothetical protein